MAANHTKLIGLGVGAILAISAAPMYAVLVTRVLTR